MHFPFPRHDRTTHIRIDLRACEACGSCVEACTRNALGLLPYAFHHHVHVDHADRCRGCMRCVEACAHGAIHARGPRPPRARAVAPSPGTARDQL